MSAAILDLYDRGRYLDAWQAAMAAGWDSWTGADLVLAARIRGRLGDAQGSRRLAARAWRQDPTHPAVAAWRLWQMFEVLGPAACLARIPTWEGRVEHHRGPAESTSWHGAVCVVWSRMRDWERAEAALERGRAADPDDPWIATCAARLAADRDRTDEAIDQARDILVRHPCYRPAILELVWWLSARDRAEESIALLHSARETMQSGDVVWSLAAILDQQGRSAEALAVLEDYPRMMPLLDHRHREGWLRMRSDLRYRCGDLAGAVADAEAGGGPFHAAVATTMRESGTAGRRVELPVPVVRQDHLTCAPATLAAISRFFAINQDQRAVADLICYDGTPDHRERRWAVDAGFLPIEFTVTWDAVRGLIDRGLPFTLTTRWATGAHLQAVIGYDERRGTILIRDPGTPLTREALAQPLLADQAAWGPRGMVLLPPGRHGEATDLDLPDAEGWTRLHRLRVALDRNDIDAAAAAQQELVNWSSDHDLRWRGQRDLAAARGDVHGRCAANRQLAERHPHDPSMLLIRLADLNETGTRRERLAAIQAARGPAETLILDYCEAVERAGDQAGDRAAAGLVHRYLRRCPDDPSAWLLLSRIAARAGDWPRARDLARTAAILAPHRRDLAEALAEACRWSGDPEAGAERLRQRCRELGGKMAEPHVTLASFLDRLDRQHEAEASLVEALTAVVEPVQAAALRLALCRRIVRQDPRRAAGLLAEARTGGDPGECRRAEALLADAAGDPAGAIAAWESVIAAEPLAIDAWRALAALHETHHGLDAALAVMERGVARHPWNSELATLRLDLLRRSGDPARYLAAARGHLGRHDGAWAVREWGFAAILAGNLEDAAEALARVERVARDEPGTLNLAGALALAKGDEGAAESAWLRSLACDVEQPWTIERLLATAGDLDRARRRLGAIQQELARQTTHGDGLWAWAEHARRWLPAGELDRILDDALAARPDLWECWSLRASQHLDRGAEQPALELLTEAVARFPRTARLHLDRGRALWRSGRQDDALEALRTCAGLAPDWGYAVRDLITRLQELGRLDEAESAARALVARCPDDPGNHAMLAAVLLIAGQRDDGLRCLGAACAMDGGDGWAWERLLGLDPGAALVAARELLRRRPRDVLAHHRLAQALRLGGEPVRAREVYESARSLPGDRLVLLLGLVAVLRQLGDLDAAEAVCREPVHGVVPRELRLEAARIRHDRGDTATALTMLDALLAEQPEDHAARQCRCEWRSQSGRHEDAIADGEDLVRRLPGRGVPWAYLGDAQAQAGRDEAARASFRSASETDGLYAYGHGRWCDLALAAADLESAATALERLRRCDDGPWTRCRALRLAMARGRPEEARADLARLATEPSGADALLAACPGTPPAHWQQTLEDAWKDPGANRGVGVLLGRSWMEALRDRAVVDRLRSTPRRDAAWHAAVAAVIEIAAQRLNRDPVTALLRTDADDVRADPIAWGLAGWFLNRQRQHGAAVAWLADWRGRSGVEGWMVLNRISCLCQLGRMAEALADAADTAPLPGADDPMLRTWRAWGAALAGDRAAAEAALADRTALVEGNAGELVHVHDITRTLASVRHRTWAMLGKLRQHHPGCSWDTLRPYVRHTARVLAAEDGRWWRRIWGWYLGS